MAKKAPVKATVKTTAKTTIKATVKTTAKTKTAVAAKIPTAKVNTTTVAKTKTPKISGTGIRALNDNFAKGEYVVHPKHGVGLIENIESLPNIDGQFYSINYEKDRMRVKIPVIKAQEIGLRKLCNKHMLDDAKKTLKGRARIRRTMWSRRAAEYEMKINSGDPVSIAEVLRDLKRSNDDEEKSYSERQIYQSALERLAREVAVIENITEDKASEKLEKIMGLKKTSKQIGEEAAKAA